MNTQIKPAVVILAAGMGTRLGRPHPKCLTQLNNNETIMGRQLRNIHNAFKDQKVTTVVGYAAEQIVESFPKEKYIYNHDYDVTNTSKSLLKALTQLPDKAKKDGVLWMNGDVVFDDDLLIYLKKEMLKGHSFISVNTNSIGEEEIKYTLDSSNNIKGLSKQISVTKASGEGIGINYVAANDIPCLIKQLKNVNNQDYFEKAIENTILFDSKIWKPFDITKLGLSAVEVDFSYDLVNANNLIVQY